VVIEGRPLITEEPEEATLMMIMSRMIITEELIEVVPKALEGTSKEIPILQTKMVQRI